MITIHMTTYKRFRSGLLERAVESVLSQSFCDFEFIICDDASTDGTSAFLKTLQLRDSRVRVIRNDRNVNSVALSLGRCMKMAAAERPWLSWMFDDCILLPDALRVLVDIVGNSDAEMVYGVTNVVLPNGSVLAVGDRSPEEVRRGVSESSVLVPNGGILIRRDVFDRHGWYDPSIVLRRSCDWDLFRRIIVSGTKIASTSAVLMEEYGALQADSLRNAFTTTFNLMSKFVQARDKAGVRLSVDEIFQMPIDWIPAAGWSSAELNLMRFMFVEYFLSVADVPRAFRWAEVLVQALSNKSLVIENLQLRAQQSIDGASLMAAGAFCGLVLEAYRHQIAEKAVEGT